MIQPWVEYYNKIAHPGRGINIAVIDNMLEVTNPEYADQIKVYPRADKWTATQS